MGNEKDEWLVKAKYCRGCMYYGFLVHRGVPCCEYTYITGLIRKTPPSRCDVKKMGEKRARKRRRERGENE